MDYFKNVCRIHTAFAVARYLMSNTAGRLSGAEKAQRHRELCQFYVAAVYGLSEPEDVHRDHDEAFQAVHTKTQELTDYLDEVISFPLEDDMPNYSTLEPLFFERFHELAMAVLPKQG